MDNYSRFLFFSFLALALGAPGVQTTELFARDDKFYMASLGDSFASGAAVTDQNRFDDNKACCRNVESWEAQMARDTSWTDSAMDFKFAACSGAKLIAAAKGDTEINQPEPQIASAGTPHLLTMQLGGNNCHFGDIARVCIYGTNDSIEYPNPAGDCSELISRWEQYVLSDQPFSGQSLYFDHHKTLQDIMEYSTIKGRDDFYFYIVGYSEFFSTVPDSDWCNNETFGVFHFPKLSHALRSKMNELVRNANSKIAQSVKDMNSDRIQFLDPSPLFENHRFCEPHHTYNNQYFLNDLWFWNLSPPETDPDYLSFASLPLQAVWQENWIANHVYPNGTKATDDDLLALSGAQGRAFHPKIGGHTAIKDVLIAMLRDKKVPGVKEAAPNPPPDKQPYASGQVHIHVKEYWSCLNSASDNLSVEITMWDSESKQIGYIKRTQAGASASAKMGSKLEDPLIVTPEWAGAEDGRGYIQFQLGNLQFDTIHDKNPSKDTYCKVGDYDPSGGPVCKISDGNGGTIDFPQGVAVRQMDCFFPAPAWQGGNPSDGSSL